MNGVSERLAPYINNIFVWLSAAMVVVSVGLAVVLIGALIYGSVVWLNAGGSDADFQSRLQLFLFADPGTNKGIVGAFPAIIGTAALTILMTIMVVPSGVITAIYLTEYAPENNFTRLVRIAIHNLAGVPSVIYGVFALGFFVYGLGPIIDNWFFSDRLPYPTFGTPGLLWSATTLALLTLPTVVVASEEGLMRIPKILREGSLALGATKFETVVRVVLPAALPSVLTGLVLAIARAAGEVAPLMLVGVVKYAPDLPVSLQAPFIALERKFMHLGFHVYDVAMHATLSEGRLGLISATSLLLVAVVGSLNISAILLRRSLTQRFDSMEGL